ncbi:glycerol-3-phosphate 1-O-acyltransferase PlsY [Fredinandcohnia onubensis]|uniref:glycerol-3-phosphate 1-O-acyltransferase PlsY n=1 Tax=Fredinandcohnia onubensis TaxID=1571209 RepID=UPI000C0BEC26|nr:glycerol-3-phosphate 1-O-acyltransferase PlsY [Fredinandcohnia onubensis]
MIYLYVIASYFIGTIMTGYVVMRFMKGEDIRKLGSGNVGARNAGRLLGKKGFLLTAIGDVLKGMVVVLGAKYLNFSFEMQILSLIAVVIGHIWPITLKFKGGKGIATAAGGLVVLAYQPFLVFGGIFLLLLLTLRSFTLAGMSAFLTVPVIYWFMDYSIRECILIFIVIALLLVAHRDNLKEKLVNKNI